MRQVSVCGFNLFCKRNYFFLKEWKRRQGQPLSSLLNLIVTIYFIYAQRHIFSCFLINCLQNGDILWLNGEQKFYCKKLDRGKRGMNVKRFQIQSNKRKIRQDNNVFTPSYLHWLWVIKWKIKQKNHHTCSQKLSILYYDANKQHFIITFLKKNNGKKTEEAT